MNLSITSQQTPQALAKAPAQTPSNFMTPSLPVIQTPALGSDSVQIRTGVLPSLKGASGGALAGGLLAGAGSYGAAVMTGADMAEMAIVLGGGLGAMAGAVTGGLVANITDDKGKASLYGALVGGGIGLGLGLAGGGIKSALTWGALGVGAGVGGAFAGSALAQRK